MYFFSLKPKPPSPALFVATPPRTTLPSLWCVSIWLLIAIGLAAAAVYTQPAHAGALTETRYCGTPSRDAKGRIIRSSTVTREFQRIHPCPSTKLPTGACPKWKKDHVISLGANHPTLGGGCDSVANMQWLPDETKLCTELDVFSKDCWELWVYSLKGTKP